MTFPRGDIDHEQLGYSDDVLERGDDFSVEQAHEGEQLDGKLATNAEQDRLPHSVLDVDTNTIDDGMVVQEAFNQSLSSFMPDIMFSELVSNYKNAKQLFGETIIRELTGYDPRFIDKNIRIPEFQRELQKKLKDKAEELEDKGIIHSSGRFTKDALNVAALFLIQEEFEEVPGKYSTFGEPVHKAAQVTGERSTIREYKKGDAYKDVAIKQSITRAIRRGHGELLKEDLLSFDREARQKVNIIYALDTSGSMKGEKLRLAKKAGVALAHRAIRDNNEVGLVIFGSSVEKVVHLTKDFFSFVQPLATCAPGQETDIALAIKEGTKLLVSVDGIKHIVLLTDGLHTTSNDPSKAVLEQVGLAQSQDITISVVGISLDQKGEELAKDIVDHSRGKLYSVADASEVGGVVIADYRSLL